MILGVVHPHNYLMPMPCVKSWLSVARKYGIYSVEGPYIYDNRNKLLQIAKEENSSILMIDADIVFTQANVDKVEIMLREYPLPVTQIGAITGIYALSNGKSPVFKRTEGDYEYTDVPKATEQISACGGGFLGLSKKLVQALPDNAFDNVFEGNVMHGEDISVCHRINEKGHKIYCDPSIKVGHVRTQVLYPVNV